MATSCSRKCQPVGEKRRYSVLASLPSLPSLLLIPGLPTARKAFSPAKLSTVMRQKWQPPASVASPNTLACTALLCFTHVWPRWSRKDLWADSAASLKTAPAHRRQNLFIGKHTQGSADQSVRTSSVLTMKVCRDQFCSFRAWISFEDNIRKEVHRQATQITKNKAKYRKASSHPRTAPATKRRFCASWEDVGCAPFALHYQKNSFHLHFGTFNNALAVSF